MRDITQSESTGKVWDNRKYTTVEDGGSAAGINSTEVSGEDVRTHIASGEYGKETFYRVEMKAEAAPESTPEPTPQPTPAPLVPQSVAAPAVQTVSEPMATLVSTGDAKTEIPVRELVIPSEEFLNRISGDGQRAEAVRAFVVFKGK